MQSSFISSLLWNDDQNHKPVITPPIGSIGEQFLLLPSNRVIRVLSLKNGNLISQLNPCLQSDTTTTTTETSLEIKKLQLALLPKKKTKKTKNILSSSGIATDEEKEMTDVSSDDEDEDKNDNDDDDDESEEEWVILALCKNGTISEWKLKSILGLKMQTNDSSHSDMLLYARRQFCSSKLMIYDFTAIHLVGGIAYFLSKEIKNDNDDEITCLVRATIPSYDGNDDEEDSKIISLDHNYKEMSRFKDVKKYRAQDDDGDKKSPCCYYTFSSSQNDEFIFVLVLNLENDGFLLYCEKKENPLWSQTFNFPFKGHGKNTVAAISPNGKDVALGYDNGAIQVFRNILSMSVDRFNDNQKNNKNDLDFKAEDLVTQTFHWHPLPLKALHFSGGSSSRSSAARPFLLSGGEESVLVTWNLDRGLTRPTHTLPRVAKGSITSIVVNEFSNELEIVLICSDCTVQLIHAHNYVTQWKIQGLASGTSLMNNNNINNNVPIMNIDPRTGLPMLTRLTGSPGYIQWFDPKSSRVVGELEVAPYNRVSRKEKTDPQLPKPEVTHLAMSKSGDDMITVDTMLSENQHVGVSREVHHNNGISTTMSLTTTIKFWKWIGYTTADTQQTKKKFHLKDMPYEMISAMPSPHGLFGSIDSLAISPNGSCACSLSHEDGSFRIWGRGLVGGGNNKTNRRSSGTTVWKSLYKVTIPSGYSLLNNTSYTTTRHNHQNNLVSFSSDGSIIAVAHDQDITLWDHSNAVLLNTINSTKNDVIQNIEFLQMPNDMILSIGPKCFEVLPPSGQGYLGMNGKWSYNYSDDSTSSAKDGSSNIIVQVIVQIPELNEIAIAMTQKNTNTSVVMILDAISGKPKCTNDEKSFSFRWKIHGTVTNMCTLPSKEEEYMKVWSEQSNYCLLVMTDHGDMIALSKQDANGHNNLSTNSISEKSTLFSPSNFNKNRHLAPTLTFNKNKRVKKSEEKSLDTNPFGINPDASSSPHIPSSELPVLSGAFTRNFIGRNLKRGKVSQ